MPSASLPHASAQHGDQTLLTHALDEWHLEVHGPRSKRKLPRPKWLWLHRDWWLNMRPTKKEHVAMLDMENLTKEAFDAGLEKCMFISGRSQERQ